MASQLVKHARLANRNIGLLDSCLCAEVPIFLCPTLLRRTPGLQRPLHQLRVSRKLPQDRSRYLHSHAQAAAEPYKCSSHTDVTSLPAQCAGCGAVAQTVDANDAGYYNLNRRTVKAYLDWNKTSALTEEVEHDCPLHESPDTINSGLLDSLGLKAVKPKGTFCILPLLKLC